MDYSLILKAAAALSGLGLLFGALLAVAFSRFRVEVDERVEEVLAVLPGSNCGACGLPGCEAAAEAIVDGEAPVTMCRAGGPDTAEAVAAVMGVEARGLARQVAHVRCRGGESVSPRLAFYEGVNSCRGAQLAAGGGKACPFGCLGLEDCAKACPVNAIGTAEEGVREVKVDKCTGCGLCVDACPRGLIQLVPAGQNTLVRCSSQYTGKGAVELCKVACIGCGKCAKACEYDAIHVVDGVAVIDFEKCTDCGECAAVCPTDSIQIRTGMPGPSGKGGFVIPPKHKKAAAEGGQGP